MKMYFNYVMIMDWFSLYDSGWQLIKFVIE